MSIILTRPQPNIVMPDGAWIGRTANGPKVEFDDTNNYLEITGCNVSVGGTVPGAKLDVVGYIKMQDNVTDATTKNGFLLGGHYTNAEENVQLMSYASTSGDNALYIGGANASYNAVTQIAFYTAGSNTTVTGTQRLSIDYLGNFDFNSGDVYFENSSSNAGFGTPTPSNPIHCVTNPATTNTIVDVLRLDRTTSGTVADGIGCGLVLYAEDASGNVEEAANIDAVFTTAAHATQVGEMRLGVMGTDIVAIDSKKNVVLAPAAIATDATDGFTYIPTCAGAPTGVPTAKTGTVALVFDTSNNKLYAYDGGWLNVTLAA